MEGREETESKNDAMRKDRMVKRIKTAWNKYKRRRITMNPSEPSSSSTSTQESPTAPRRQPTTDERPTIKFLEMIGPHSWSVEYYGKYDNQRGKHVKLIIGNDNNQKVKQRIKRGAEYNCTTSEKQEGATKQ